MICIADDIVKDQGSPATDPDNNIDTPVIIEISHSKPPGGIRLFEGRTTRSTDIIKPPAVVVKKQKWLSILQAAVDCFDEFVRVPIDQNQIRSSIQIEIDKATAPTCIHHSRHADSGRSGYIRKCIVPGIVVQRIALTADVGDEKIFPAIPIKIGPIYAHARARSTIRAIRHSRLETDFFKLAAALIQIQEVGNGIIRDKQVEQAIVVDVSRDHPKGLPQILPNPGRGTYVGEGSIAVVLIETARPWFVGLGIAIVVNPVYAAILFQRLVVLYEVTDKQIEQTVVVRIKPHSAGEQARRVQARSFGHIGKGSVTVVVIENQSSIGCYQNIGPSVSIVVGDCNSNAEISSRHACLFRHIGKGAVPVVAIQSIA